MECSGLSSDKVFLMITRRNRSTKKGDGVAHFAIHGQCTTVCAAACQLNCFELLSTRSQDVLGGYGVYCMSERTRTLKPTLIS